MMAIQQIMLGTLTGTEEKALETLAAVKAAGFEGIGAERIYDPSDLFCNQNDDADGRNAHWQRQENWIGHRLLPHQG